jgi:hypothetical protein
MIGKYDTLVVVFSQYHCPLEIPTEALTMEFALDVTVK